jgi:hypothetical protein
LTIHRGGDRLSPVRCWRCDRVIDPTDRYCRACGEGQGPALAWYYRPLWIALLALTALGPFAVVLIMRTPRLSRDAKWNASLVLLLFFAWVGWQMWVDTKALLDSI